MSNDSLSGDTGPEAPEPVDAVDTRGRRLATWALEIWVLCAFAIAQPLFALLGDNATFFIAHRAEGAEIVWFAVTLVIAVPAALFAVDCVAEIIDIIIARLLRSRSRTVRLAPVVHVIILGVLVAATLTPPLARAVGSGPNVWLAMMAVLAICGAYLFARFSPLRRVVRYAAFAPPLFVVLFLFGSPVSDLVGGPWSTSMTETTGGAATLGPGTVDTPPIVWMVLDEFPLSLLVGPDGELEADRYPNLARLASMSTWYPNYTAGAVFTERAVPAMLTGRWPTAGQLPIASQQPDNLFSIVDGPDYPVAAYEFLTDMCPTDVCEDRPEPEGVALWGDIWAVYLRHLLPESAADRFVGRIDQNWTGFGLDPAASAATDATSGDDQGDADDASSDQPDADQTSDAEQDDDDDWWLTDGDTDGDNAVYGAIDDAGDDLVDGGVVGADGSDRVEGDGGGSTSIHDETARWAVLAEMAHDFNGNVDLFGAFVEPLRDSDLRGLHYLHMRLPHGPVRYLPDGRKYIAYFEPRTQGDGSWPDDEASMRTMMQRTVVQAMFADRLVGEMLDALEESGRLDETVIVVSSDHGGSLRPGAHPRSMDDEDSALDSVPALLLIKDAGGTGGTVDTRRAQQVDILPTVLELIGMDPHGRESVPADRALDGLAMTPGHDRQWRNRIVIRATDQGPVEYVDPPVFMDSPTIGWIRSMLPYPTNPYALGPAGDVVGLLSGTSDHDMAPFAFIPDAPDMFEDVHLKPRSGLDPDDVTGSFLPVLISGVIDQVPGAVHVAAVVNGRVAGVGESFLYEGVQRVSILIDPDTLRDGPNDVSFLTIDTEAESLDLVNWSTMPVLPNS